MIKDTSKRRFLDDSGIIEHDLILTESPTPPISEKARWFSNIGIGQTAWMEWQLEVTEPEVAAPAEKSRQFNNYAVGSSVWIEWRLEVTEAEVAPAAEPAIWFTNMAPDSTPWIVWHETIAAEVEVVEVEEVQPTGGWEEKLPWYWKEAYRRPGETIAEFEARTGYKVTFHDQRTKPVTEKFKKVFTVGQQARLNRQLQEAQRRAQFYREQVERLRMTEYYEAISKIQFERMQEEEAIAMCLALLMLE